MERLITLRRCLLALALAFVQLAVPVSAYAQMSRSGALLQDICSASGTRQVSEDSSGTQDGGQTLGANHAQHCAFCTTSPAILPAVALADFVQLAPEGVIRVGSTWYQPHAIAPTPPATGPPRCA